MRAIFFRLCLLIIPVIVGCEQQEEEILTTIQILQNQGDFTAADSLIKTYVQENKPLSENLHRKLMFELERSKRIRNDYRLSEAELMSALQKRMSDFSETEFRQWENEDRFDILIIDGNKRFANPSVSNLFFRYPELRRRRKNYTTYSQTARLVFAQAQELKAMAGTNPDQVRLPRPCRVRQSIMLKENKVPIGETVFCWLPYPSVFQTQGDVKFITSSHNPVWLDHPASKIRSVHLQAPVPDKGDLYFFIEYEYTAYAYYQEIDPGKVISFNQEESIYRDFTSEENPHEVFTPELMSLSARIVGDETNPYLKAQRIYNWLADSIKYSYAREYSTLRNISAYCYKNRFGDCGQAAILFITMCRIAGIPARWQSGFFTFPDDEGMHDWAEIFIKPYGWLPVDIYMGMFFTSMTEDLLPAQRMEMRDFYFGNIDHYRLVANKGHNQLLYPPKKHFRSETVDFQRGEIEWAEANLYFTDWRWRIVVNDITNKKSGN